MWALRDAHERNRDSRFSMLGVCKSRNNDAARSGVQRKAQRTQRLALDTEAPWVLGGHLGLNACSDRAAQSIFPGLFLQGWSPYKRQ